MNFYLWADLSKEEFDKEKKGLLPSEDRDLSLMENRVSEDLVGVNSFFSFQVFKTDENGLYCPTGSFLNLQNIFTMLVTVKSIKSK